MRGLFLAWFVLIVGWTTARSDGPPLSDLGSRVGAAAVELEADDDMVIGGGILPGKVKGQEGKLRAVAVVVEEAAAREARSPSSRATC